MQHTLLVFARNACKNSIGCNVTGARVLSYLKAMKVGYNDTEFASVTLTNGMNNIFPYLRNSGCVFCDDICKECTRIFEEVKVQMYKKRI